MKIIKINSQRPQKSVIKKAAEVLKFGGVIAYPTDTCYGLGADITNSVAVKKIYSIKHRDKKALSMIIKKIDEIENYADIDDNRKKFLEKYFPGALTAVLLNLDYKNIKMNTVAFRIPNYEITRKLMEEINFPLTTTSANVSGKNVCYNVEEIIEQFKDQKFQPDLILDAGELVKNPPSTVVDLINWPPRVLRQGSVKVKIKD